MLRTATAYYGESMEEVTRDNNNHVSLQLTSPMDLISRVHRPRNLRMMKPPRMVLTSGMPLPAA